MEITKQGAQGADKSRPTFWRVKCVEADSKSLNRRLEWSFLQDDAVLNLVD